MVSYPLPKDCYPIIQNFVGDVGDGLTADRWQKLHEDGVVKNDEEVYRLVYYGGVQQEIRKDVWPYLLGHYQ